MASLPVVLFCRTWSDREIRTLLSRMYPLPLDYGNVVDFENAIINCSRSIDLRDTPTSPPPAGERYLDSTLVRDLFFFFILLREFVREQKSYSPSSFFLSSQPIVSRELILRCDAIVGRIHAKFGVHEKYPHKIIEAGKDDIFEMLTSNVSTTVRILDEIRSDPKYVTHSFAHQLGRIDFHFPRVLRAKCRFRKFICLNDNLDPQRHSENELVRALLSDFYRSLYPMKSTFELPPQYRNRFTHRDELLEWRANRARARNAMLVLVALLLGLTVYNAFRHKIRRLWAIRTLPTLLV